MSARANKYKCRHRCRHLSRYRHPDCDIHSNFRYNFWLKARPNLKMAAILKISKYFRQFDFVRRYEKNVTNYFRNSIFGADDITNDVTAWRQKISNALLNKKVTAASGLADLYLTSPVNWSKQQVNWLASSLLCILTMGDNWFITNLPHWGWDKMDAISQTTFSRMKMFEFWLNFNEICS